VVQKLLFAVTWDPYNSNKMFSTIFEHIEGFVDCFLFIDELLVDLYDRVVVLVVATQVVEESLL